jgi:stage V sporulation protein K
MKRYHELAVCTTKCVPDYSPEYFTLSFDFRLQFFVRQSDLKELTLRLFDDNLHPVGCDAKQLIPTSTYRDISFSIAGEESPKDKPYTAFIYVNGQPRWTTDIRISKRYDVETNATLRSIEPESEEMFLALNAFNAPWWSGLSNFTFKRSAMQFLLSRIHHFTTMLESRAWKLLPNICIISNPNLASRLANDVFAPIATRSHTDWAVSTSLDEIAMCNSKEIDSLYTRLRMSDVAIVELRYRHRYTQAQMATVMTFFNDLHNWRFERTTFIFHCTEHVARELEDCCLPFVYATQDIGMFRIDSYDLELTPEQLSVWEYEQSREVDDEKMLKTAECNPEPTEEMDSAEAAEPKPVTYETSDAEQELQEMIGLERVKREVNDVRNMALFNMRRATLHLGDATDNRHHMLFLGNPGTGKTTVAKLIGRMYHSMGILSSGHTHEVNRSMLVGEYIGQTEQRTQEAIEKARGGVLFIDEAYALFDDSRAHTNDFGKQVINSLLPILAEPNPDMIVIMAGYEGKIDYMLQSNQGLRERFPISIHFDDYSAAELWEIAHYICDQRRFTLTSEADERLRRYIEEETRVRSASFSNARWVSNLMFQGVIKQMATRVNATTSDTDLLRLYTTIEEADVIAAVNEVSSYTPSIMERSRIGFR